MRKMSGCKTRGTKQESSTKSRQHGAAEASLPRTDFCKLLITNGEVGSGGRDRTADLGVINPRPLPCQCSALRGLTM